MKINDIDLVELRAGRPPKNDDLLHEMTLGREVWLDRFQEHYLYNHIERGHGSKVKVLVGGEGIGKTHLLRCVERDARIRGYEVVYISLCNLDHKLNNLPSLYKTIVEQINTEELVRGLCRTVANRLGYGGNEYQGLERLLPLIVEKEGMLINDARREIRTAIGHTFRSLDIGPTFITFCNLVTSNRMISGNEEMVKTVIRWLAGEKLDRHQKAATGLFETLEKNNAQAWLNSLTHILTVVGRTGLVVMIDDLEKITKRGPERRYLYTPNAIKDTFELFRQLIDDAELLNSFVLLLAGRKEIIEDEKRGFKSYEALWMRLQTGLVPGKHFNPFCDIVDIDLHCAAIGADFPQRVDEKLIQLFQDAGYRRTFREVPNTEHTHELRARIIETASMMEREAE